LGIVLFAHGAQSLLGWFGGPGFNNTIIYLTDAMHLPYVVAISVILLQFFGALLLIFGAFTRAVAVAVATMFIGMIVTVHIPFGFFMNWFGNQPGEGYEYHLLVIALSTASLIDGAGIFSVDRLLTTKTSDL
jgi:putative oxidoreductase